MQQTRVERVQNVNTDQSVLDRILRVGQVDFDTAGTDDSDFTFRGVADPERGRARRRQGAPRRERAVAAVRRPAGVYETRPPRRPV